MSTMRNAVQRRNHKERGQPEERKKWGLLEKHKDYSARAKDFNRKKAHLKTLRQKVLDKNPDEFYFGMINQTGPSVQASNFSKKWTGTVNASRGNQVLSQDAVRLLKTQDMGYIRTMRNKALKEVAEGEKEVVGIDASGKVKGMRIGKKVVFLEGREELEIVKEKGDAEGLGPIEQAEWDDDDSEEEEEEEDDLTEAEKALRQLQKEEKERKARRLEKARKTLEALTEAELALDLQRAKMAKSSTQLKGINKHGKKFTIKDRKR